MSGQAKAVGRGRRGFLAGGGGALATAAVASQAPGGTPAAHPDARLIELCSMFDALQVRINGMFEGPGGIIDDDERRAHIAPLEALQKPLLDQICRAQAVTLAGLKARAATFILSCADDLSSDEITCWDNSMRAAIIRDLERL